jgi:hypothetical protein
VNAGQNTPQNADGSANNANNSQQKPNANNTNNQQNQGGSQMWNVMSEKNAANSRSNPPTLAQNSEQNNTGRFGANTANSSNVSAPKSSVNAPVSSTVNSETLVNTPANSQSAPKPQSQGGSQSGGNKPYIVPNSKAANAGNPQSNSRNSGTANPPVNVQNKGKNGNAPANAQNNGKKADAPASVQSKGKNQPAANTNSRFGNQANTKPPTHGNSSSNGSPAPIDVRDSEVFDKGKNAPSEAATPETASNNSVNTNE